MARLQIAHDWWTNTPEVSYNPQEPPKSRLDNIGILGVGRKRYSGIHLSEIHI